MRTLLYEPKYIHLRRLSAEYALLICSLHTRYGFQLRPLALSKPTFNLNHLPRMLYGNFAIF